MANPPLSTLLSVQELDTSSDQLARRRETLSARGELATAISEDARLHAELDAVAGRAHEVERHQRRLEDEVATLEDKASAADRQLYSGSVTAPRELQALQDEVASLRRRIGTIEDELLAVMEEREPVDAEVTALRTAAGEVAERAAGLRETLRADEKAIAAELTEVAASRTALAAEVPGDLLARYERIRARAGGAGIARLDGHRCTGCHLELPNREVDELRRAPADEIVVHDECGRILVRD